MNRPARRPMRSEMRVMTRSRNTLPRSRLVDHSASRDGAFAPAFADSLAIAVLLRGARLERAARDQPIEVQHTKPHGTVGETLVLQRQHFSRPHHVIKLCGHDLPLVRSNGGGR